MTTRRSFIAGAAAAAAGVAAAKAAGAAPTPTAGTATKVASTPAPTPSPTPAPPSSLARELARSLQKTLPNAKLADPLTLKIAGDIEGNLVIPKAFRKIRLHNWDEPDFAFFAEPEGECQ